MALKSAYEAALEKMKTMGIDDARNLSDAQKDRIAEIKNIYDAKIAEKRILLKHEENMPDEIAFLERERERKIEEIYGENKK
jgi:ribonuclease HIII